MKLLLLFVLAVSSLSAATYYQDFASGNDANNGLSWAQAKKTLPIISGGGGGPNCSRWNTHATNPIGLAAGDTVYLSGGSSSVTIDVSGGWEPPYGSAGNPITYKIGQETARNGTLNFNYNASFGGAAQWINGPHDVIVSGLVGTDTATLHFKLTNWPRQSAANPTAQRSFALASIGNNFLIEGVDATDGLSAFIENPGSVNFYGFEMRHCIVYCDDINGNAIVSLAGPDTPSFAANKVHHCTLRGTYTTGGNGYDIFKGSGGMSMYDNFMYWVRDANYVIPGQHADGWQGGGGSYMEFYNNTVLNCTNYGVYAEATVATVPNSITPGWAHLRIYNNVFTMTDPALQSGTGPIAICIGPNTSVWNTQLFYGDDIVVANNNIVDCSTLPQITLNVNAGQTGVWTNVRIQNNVIVNCGTGALDLRGNTTSTVSNNVLNLSSSTAASAFLSYTANAGTANNLSLSATATSLLDQGLSMAPLFTMDKAGKLRVGAWDIGAFEYASVAPSNAIITITVE